jgi:hypothetical protein
LGITVWGIKVPRVELFALGIIVYESSLAANDAGKEVNVFHGAGPVRPSAL